MKTVSIKFVFSLFIILLTSCSDSKNTPESVASKFTQYIYTAKFDKSKDLCTEEAKKVMEMLPDMMQAYITQMKKSDPKIELKSCELNESGTQATVTFSVTNGINLMKGGVDVDPTPQTATVYLQKESDKWLVSRFK